MADRCASYRILIVVIDAGTRRRDRAAARAIRYERWVARTSRLLDVLALIFLIDFLFSRVAPNGPPWWQPTLNAISFLIWFAFAIDYAVRLGLSPQRWPFVRTHKLDLVMVLLPMLRMLTLTKTLTELCAQIESLAAQQAQLRATIEQLTEQRSA